MCISKNNIGPYTLYTKSHRILYHRAIKRAYYFTIHCVIPFYSAFVIVLSASMNISIWRIEEQAPKTQSLIATPMEHAWKYIEWKMEKKLLYRTICVRRSKAKKKNHSHWRFTWKLQSSESAVSIRKAMKFDEKSVPFSFRCFKDHHYRIENKKKIQCGKMDLLLAAMPTPTETIRGWKCKILKLIK